MSGYVPSYRHSLEYKLNILRQAESDLAAYVKFRWPVGRWVTWRRGTRLQQYGEVCNHSYDRRIKVRNERTRKAYWIDCAYLIEHDTDAFLAHTNQKYD